MPSSCTHDLRDDARLVARFVAGDDAAFRQLFDAYSPLVYRIAYRMLGHHDDAADLTQDIFVRAYGRLSSLRDGQAFQAWLTRLAINMAHDHARKVSHPTLSLDIPPGDVDGMEWHFPSPAPDGETRAISGELAERVQRALLTLSREHRTVVILHHLEQMPVEEIAGLLRLPTGTVKSRLARARAELQRKLEGYFEE